MSRAFAKLPFLLKLLSLGALSMWAPAVFALVNEEHFQARMFFYTGVFGLFLVSMVALATANRTLNESGFQQVIHIGASLVILPFFLAIPMYEVIGNTAFLNAYLDIAGAYTTTGLRVFDPTRLPETLHLWRAFVAWQGGALMWVVAAAVLAPLNLGGFEVSGGGTGPRVGSSHSLNFADRQRLLARAAQSLLPAYFGFTVSLWLILTVLGSPSLDALIHAMSVMSTSGISGQEDFVSAQSGLVGEFFVFCFFAFALTRIAFSQERMTVYKTSLWRDPEFRLALFLVFMLSAALFARHWWSAFGDEIDTTWAIALKALWGGIFTVASFLTTTGFVSEFWHDAQSWSGLETPGFLFMGLALIGGGVATTAGGVKLLRVYSLYLSILRELDRMEHPSSVGQSRNFFRADLRAGAFIAWVFFMLFVVAIAVFTMIFAWLGLDFEHAIVMAISTLTTTGPILDVAGLGDFGVIAMSGALKLFMVLAMICGRLEILVVLALMAPSAWRR
jgi:trk system potassium uptake protein TrkH